MLSLNNIDYHWGAQSVLAGVSVFVGRGQKVGLAGPNGAGKTTLLRIAAGEVTPDAGSVGRPKAVGYLSQTPALADTFSADADVREVLVSASPTAPLASELHAAERRMSDATGEALDQAIRSYGELEERYRTAGGYAVEARAASVLHGLGLARVGLERKIAGLSSGERTRLEMARVLVGGADLLLLDEPTNHLDADGTRWLMQFLERSEAGVFLISHDLRLLDHSISRVYELDGQTHGVSEFKGSYSAYLEWSEQSKRVQQRTRTRQLADLKRLRSTADRFRHGSEKMARRAKVLDRRAARMRAEVVDAPTAAKSLGLVFKPVDRTGRVALRVRGLAMSYGENQVLRSVSFELERGQRLAVIGVNGAGKSTLLNLLAGRGSAAAGSIELGHNVNLGRFTHEFQAEAARLSAYEHLTPLVSGGEGAIRGALAQLLFGTDHAFRPIETLSAGERARLGIAKLMLERRNLLLLDEPNSNLDTQTRGWVLDALKEYGASVVAVSHDREFVEGLKPDHVLLMPDETFEPFEPRHLELVEPA